jgi:hypothetical protein
MTAAYDHLAHYTPSLTPDKWYTTRERALNRTSELHPNWEQFSKVSVLIDRIESAARNAYIHYNNDPTPFEMVCINDVEFEDTPVY